MLDDPDFIRQDEWWKAYIHSMEETVEELREMYANDPKVVFQTRKLMPPESSLDLLETIYEDVPPDFLEDYLRVRLANIPSVRGI